MGRNEQSYIVIVDVVVQSLLARAPSAASQLQQTALVRVAAAVHVFDRCNRLQNRILVHGRYESEKTSRCTRQRSLDHDPMDRAVLVELADLLQHLFSPGRCVEFKVAEIHSAPKRKVLFLIHESLGVRIVAKANHSETRSYSRFLFDMAQTQSSLRLGPRTGAYLLCQLFADPPTI